MPDDKITAFVVVYNEYLRINTCLASLYGQMDELLLFDDSSDKKRTELQACYRHWKDVFEAAGCDFRIFPFEHRGSHSLYYPDVLREASHQWLFQLDGDEVLKPMESFSFGYLRACVRKAMAMGAVAVQGILLNIKQEGSKFINCSWEPKTRLYDKSHGHYPQNRHYVEWIPAGSKHFEQRLVIHHVRTDEEMEEDARVYFEITLREYQLATTDGDRHYYLDVFDRQNEFYKWGYKSINEAIELDDADRRQRALYPSSDSGLDSKKYLDSILNCHPLQKKEEKGERDEYLPCEKCGQRRRGVWWPDGLDQPAKCMGCNSILLDNIKEKKNV